MQHSQTTYPYKPLKAGEIRVLELEPGELEDSSICVKLKHVGLDELPLYDALSYTWGDARTHVNITLDGNESFMVTRNAYHALSDLRAENDVTRLWIDAICINQQDFNERNHQVSLMQRIYAQARVVRTWLDYSLDVEIVDRLQTLSEVNSADDLGDDAAAWKPMAEIAELPYWKRVWIQQELAFARHNVIHCHKSTIDGSVFARFQELVHGKGFSNGGWIETDWMLLQGHFVHLAKADDTDSCENGKTQSSTPVRGKHFKTLFEALSQSRHLQATDPRDRVYALLGLAEDVDSTEYKISYEATVAEVYSDVVFHMLQRDRSLAFLCVSASRSQILEQQLPSWVPDWSASNMGQPDKTRLFENTITKMNNITTQNSFAQILNDGKILSIHGMLIHKIMKVCSHTVWNADGKEMPYFEDWADLLDLDVTDVSDEEISTETFNSLRSKTEAIPPSKWENFLSILLGLTTDSSDQDQFPLGEWIPFLTIVFPIGLQLQLAKTYVLDDVLSKSQLDSWFVLFDHILLATLGKVVLVTDDGGFALGPPETRMGDEVWVVQQCPMFMILRQACNQYHEVVGPIQLAGHYEKNPIDVVVSRGVEPAFHELRLK